jgi:hypothetical protein
MASEQLVVRWGVGSAQRQEIAMILLWLLFALA